VVLCTVLHFMHYDDQLYDGVEFKPEMVRDATVEWFRLQKKRDCPVQLLSVLAAVHLCVLPHLIPLVGSDLVQNELLRHVRIEAEISRRRQQVVKDGVHGWKTNVQICVSENVFSDQFPIYFTPNIRSRWFRVTRTTKNGCGRALLRNYNLI